MKVATAAERDLQTLRPERSESQVRSAEARANQPLEAAERTNSSSSDAKE